MAHYIAKGASFHAAPGATHSKGVGRCSPREHHKQEPTLHGVLCFHCAMGTSRRNTEWRAISTSALSIRCASSSLADHDDDAVEAHALSSLGTVRRERGKRRFELWFIIRDALAALLLQRPHDRNIPAQLRVACRSHERLEHPACFP